MRTRTKIILGLVLFLPVLFGIAFVGGIIWGAIDPEGQERAREEINAQKEAEEDRLANTPEGWDAANKKLAEEQKAGYYVSKDQSKLSESQYENMVLNYKGKDSKGFSIKDFADARCRDNQESFADYTGDIFDDKSGYYEVRIFSPINTNLNPPCLGATWYFGVNNQGDVIAWDWSAERQDILDYLDEQG